ncbi:hypothetical protein [Muricoccus aerilatus]|uniref:hypothetical protein n=1 Tax=Muricoccus aerilatus TaxID=452982 RepID=UPI0005C1D668|nr:hypothetical protein [Roseomonas aerilata]
MRYVLSQSNAAAITSARLRAFRSLSDAQARELEAGLASLPGTWEIDRQEGYDGHLTLVITARDAAPELFFAVWRTSTGLQMSTMQADEQISVQAFSSIDAVLLAIRRCVAPGSLLVSLPSTAHFRLV